MSLPKESAFSKDHPDQNRVSEDRVGRVAFGPPLPQPPTPPKPGTRFPGMQGEMVGVQRPKIKALAERLSDILYLWESELPPVVVTELREVIEEMEHA